MHWNSLVTDKYNIVSCNLNNSSKMKLLPQQYNKRNHNKMNPTGRKQYLKLQLYRKSHSFTFLYIKT